MFSVVVAVTFSQILGILTGGFTAGAAGYDDGNPVVRMAVSVLTFTVPASFYLGVALLYARVTPVAPPALRHLLAVLASAMAWTTLLLGLPPLAVLLLR
uniref:Uncharacterized protein n=1 Tax=Oryza brachyantha TaxID=4533 RepID=J3MC47_ORYBR